MSILDLSLFALAWATVLYLFNSLIFKHFIRIEYKVALLYMTTVAFIGLYGEIFLDTVYNKIVGVPLWQYLVLPIHNSFTSFYATVIWGLYGFHLYLLHGSLAKKIPMKTWKLALIFSLEALILEALLNISFKLLFGTYVYYYFPSDWWQHVSTFQNIPFYYICGLLIVETVKRFKLNPVFYICMNLSLLVFLVLIV